MRLNIGCGRDYLPGYVNVDPYEREVADVVTEADKLDFVPDGSAEEICSYQLLEHLGFVDAHRTLAHWARKLAPGGLLIIETPDLERSLEAASIRHARPDVDWLFGSGDPGQTHQRPFFKAELKAILEMLGYTSIMFKEPLGYWKVNAIRLEARMGKQKRKARVLEAWCAPPMDQGTFYELPLELLGTRPDETLLARLACMSPRLAVAALRCETEPNLQWLRVLEELDAALIEAMYQRLLEFALEPKMQEKAVLRTKVQFENAVMKMLKTGHVEASGVPRPKGRVTPAFFCQQKISEASVLECALGIKEFSKGRHDMAKEHLERSLGFDRENIIAWWNLARVEWISGRDPKKHFLNAYLISKDDNAIKEMKRKVPVKRPLEMNYASQI